MNSMLARPVHLAVVFLATLLASSLAGAAPRPEFAIVKKGEWLAMIADRYGTTVDGLVRLNRLKTSVLQPGQKLRLRRPTPSLSPIRNSVILEAKTIYGVPVKVVRVNLTDPRVYVTPLLPPGGLGHGTRLDRMAAGSSALAIVNGGYFHPTSFFPAGDLVVRGRHISAGSRVRTAIAITPDNLVSVRASAPGTLVSWRGLETVVASGPYILRGGRVTVTPRVEGYRDPAVWGRAARSAIGLSSDRKLFILCTRLKITLPELAAVMRALGAREAITLDGGSSVGLAWKGKVLIHPARRLSYGIAVYANDPRGVTAGR